MTIPSEWNKTFGKKKKVDVRMPQTLLRVIDKWVHQGRYSNRSEFVREACWRLAELLEGQLEDETPESTKDLEEAPPGHYMLPRLDPYDVFTYTSLREGYA